METEIQNLASTFTSLNQTSKEELAQKMIEKGVLIAKREVRE